MAEQIQEILRWSGEGEEILVLYEHMADTKAILVVNDGAGSAWINLEPSGVVALVKALSQMKAKNG